MKRIWQWIREHLWIVIFSLVTLLVLPAGFVMSSMWNKSIRTERQTKAEDDYKKLDVKVTYTLPALIPGATKVEVPAAPNERITTFFAEQRKTIEADRAAMLAEAKKINQQEHKVLIDGLFPNPPAQELQAKIFDFLKVLVGDDESKVPSIYAELLKQLKAGSPPEVLAVINSINEMAAREVEKHKANTGNAPMTADQLDALNKKLSDFRLGAYQARAHDLSIYAGLDSFTSYENKAGWSMPPLGVPTADTNIVQCMLYQWDYWVFSDLLKAVAKANTGPDGKLFTGIENSVVKRLDKIGVRDLPVKKGAAFLADEKVEPTSSGEVPLDYRKSITGRLSSRANQQYDVRGAQLVVVVSSERLPALLDAINRTNFMTVTSLQLDEVDLQADLEQGYYYGNEHVVRATVDIETIWLRDWVAPIMPKEVKELMAVPIPEPAAAETTGGGEAAPSGGRDR